MSRLPPATRMEHSLPCCPTLENGLSFAYPIRWGSTPRGWMAGLMTRRLAGRAEDCGPPSAPGPRFTPRPAKEQPARSCISRSGPTRWLGEPARKAGKAERSTAEDILLLTEDVFPGSI